MLPSSPEFLPDPSWLNPSPPSSLCWNVTISLPYYVFIVSLFPLEYKFVESRDFVSPVPLFRGPGSMPGTQGVPRKASVGEWVNKWSCVNGLTDAKRATSLNVHHSIPTSQCRRCYYLYLTREKKWTKVGGDILKKRKGLKWVVRKDFLWSPSSGSDMESSPSTFFTTFTAFPCNWPGQRKP